MLTEKQREEIEERRKESGINLDDIENCLDEALVKLDEAEGMLTFFAADRELDSDSICYTLQYVMHTIREKVQQRVYKYKSRKCELLRKQRNEQVMAQFHFLTQANNVNVCEVRIGDLTHYILHHRVMSSDVGVLCRSVSYGSTDAMLNINDVKIPIFLDCVCCLNEEELLKIQGECEKHGYKRLVVSAKGTKIEKFLELWQGFENITLEPISAEEPSWIQFVR